MCRVCHVCVLGIPGSHLAIKETEFSNADKAALLTVLLLIKNLVRSLTMLLSTQLIYTF